MSKIKLSIDDGCKSDTRIAALAKKYNIECIFYWPVEMQSLAYDNGYEPLNYREAYNIASEFEIGSHTITHRHLTKLELGEALHEIADSKIMLENLYHVKINKFCFPRGYTNETLDGLIAEYYKERRLTKGEGLVHIHPNSGANKNKPWRKCINNKTIELWGHSWELDKYAMWDELERVLREIAHS